MALTRIVNTDSSWRSYSYPAMAISGARLGNWRAVKPNFVAHGDRSTQAHGSSEEPNRNIRPSVHTDVNAEDVCADANQDTPID